MNSVQKVLSIAGLCLSMASAASAAAITGSINFNSAFTASSMDLTQPGTLTVNGPTTINAGAPPTGSFAILPLNAAVTTNTSFGINGAGNAVTINGAPANQLWSVGAGPTFTFTSTSIVEVLNNSDFISLKSVGVLNGTGGAYDPTPGIWTASFQLNGQTLSSSFSAASSAVPDGGSTAALLGLSLLGVVWFARRKS